MTVGRMHALIEINSVKYLILLFHAKCLSYEQH